MSSLFHLFRTAGRRLSSAWRRSVHAIPTAIGIVILNFLLLQLAPGDAADVLAGEAGGLTEQTMQALRRDYGLDLPILRQLVNYLYDLGHLDLGTSARFGLPVTQLIGERLPNTLLLMGSALVISLFLGLLFGVVMASFARRLPDRILSFVVLLFYSIPGFWIGLMLIVLFSVHLAVLPSGGAETVASDFTGWAAIADKARHLVLPATSLALFYIAIYSRITRTAMLETKSKDFVRTAKAKGLHPFQVTFRHVLRNALIPITTLVGLHVGGMLGGAVVVEMVYTWPGLGRLAVESVLARDFKVLLGILLMSSILVIIINIVVDLLHEAIDPRIEGLQ